MIESRLALTSRLSSWCPLQNKFCYQIRILFQPHHQRQVAAGQVGDHRGTWHQGDQVLPEGRGEGTEKVDNTACIWYNVYIKYRRCFYDRTTAEIGVKSIHGNI